mgnify:CR=1 FL=1
MNDYVKNYKTGCSMNSIGLILTIVLVILKATNVMDISWWWAFSPILISIGLTVFITLIGFIIFLITFIR